MWKIMALLMPVSIMAASYFDLPPPSIDPGLCGDANQQCPNVKQLHGICCVKDGQVKHYLNSCFACNDVLCILNVGLPVVVEKAW